MTCPVTASLPWRLSNPASFQPPLPRFPPRLAAYLALPGSWSSAFWPYRRRRHFGSPAGSSALRRCGKTRFRCLACSPSSRPLLQQAGGFAQKPESDVTRVLEHVEVLRSEERRVGKEGVSTCRSRWSTYH